MEEPQNVEEYKSEIFYPRSPKPRMRRVGARSGSTLDLLRAALRARQPFPTPTDADAPDRARAVAQISTAIAELATSVLIAVCATWLLVSRHPAAVLLGLSSSQTSGPSALLLAAGMAAAAATCLLVHAIAPAPRLPRGPASRGGSGVDGSRARMVRGGGSVHSPQTPHRHRSPQRGPWLLVIVLNTAALLGLLAGGALSRDLRTRFPLEPVLELNHTTANGDKTAPPSKSRSYVPPLEAAGGGSEGERIGGKWVDARRRLYLRPSLQAEELRVAFQAALSCCRPLWDKVQGQLRCCGVDGPKDWHNQGHFPGSCCKVGGICHAPWAHRHKPEKNALSRWVGTDVWLDGCLLPAALYLAEGASLLVGLSCVLSLFVAGSLALSAALWTREVRRRSAPSLDGSPPPSARASLVAASAADASALDASFADDASDSAQPSPASRAAASLDACFSSSSSAASLVEVEDKRRPRRLRPATAAPAIAHGSWSDAFSPRSPHSLRSPRSPRTPTRPISTRARIHDN